MLDILEMIIAALMILFGVGVLGFIIVYQPEDYLEQRLIMIGAPLFGILALCVAGIGIDFLLTGDWKAG